jgi:hypothetical protein
MIEIFCRHSPIEDEKENRRTSSCFASAIHQSHETGLHGGLSGLLDLDRDASKGQGVRETGGQGRLGRDGPGGGQVPPGGGQGRLGWDRPGGGQGRLGQDRQGGGQGRLGWDRQGSGQGHDDWERRSGYDRNEQERANNCYGSVDWDSLVDEVFDDEVKARLKAK